MKLTLIAIIALFSFNSFATTSVEVCTAGEFGEDNRVEVTDLYDSYSITFHETSFSIPRYQIKDIGNTASVHNLPVVISAEGTTEARVFTAAFIRGNGNTMQIVSAFDGKALEARTLKCRSVEMGEI